MARKDEKGQVFGKEYTNSAAIATSGATNVWYAPVLDADIAEFEFFNHLRIINKSNVNVALRFNHNTDSNYEFEVPAQTMAIWDHNDRIKFANIAIRNKSATTEVAISEILINIKRVN